MSKEYVKRSRADCHKVIEERKASTVLGTFEKKLLFIIVENVFVILKAFP